MFERPLHGKSMKEAEQIINKEKSRYPFMRKEANFKIEKMPLSEFITTNWEPHNNPQNRNRHKKSVKTPKRKIIKKKSCGCK
jgi:hypothetical protein